MDTVVFVDSSAIDFFANDVVLIKLDADVDSTLADQYHISGYPTFVLTNPEGEEIDRIVGSAEAEEFLQTIRNYANGIGTLDDLLRRAESEENRELFFEIADKYKYRGGSDEAGVWYARVIESGDPLDSLSGQSRISIADMHRRAKDWDKSLEEFDKIATEFKGTVYGQDAVIYKAIIYRQKGDTAIAISAFENYIEQFPESEDVKYAQRQINRLKGIEEKEEEGS